MPLYLMRWRMKNKGHAAYRVFIGAKGMRGRRNTVAGWLFFNAIVLHYQAGEVAFETLCAVGVLCASDSGPPFIRSPKCKSSRGVNHVALRLKTVGVINHLGAERRIFSAFHRVAVYITLRHFFYYFYPSCENPYFSATHRILIAACNLLLQFSQFSPLVFYENSQSSYGSSIMFRSIFHSPLLFPFRKSIYNPK